MPAKRGVIAALPRRRKRKPSTQSRGLSRTLEPSWRYEFADFELDWWTVTEDVDPRGFPPEEDEPRVLLTGDETLNLYGVPRYIKTSYERFRRVAHREGKTIPKGVGIGAMLAYGLHNIAKSSPVQPFVEAVKDIDDIEVSLDEETTLYDLVNHWSFAPQRPESSPSERWSIRTSQELKTKLYSLVSVLHLDDRSLTSALAVVAICSALCQVHNINPEARKYMERTVGSFITRTETRTDNIVALLERCKERNGQ